MNKKQGVNTKTAFFEIQEEKHKNKIKIVKKNKKFKKQLKKVVLFCGVGKKSSF